MVEAAVEPKWGELLFCGGSDWSKIGRQDKKKTAESEERSLKYPPLSGPHRLSTLKGVKVTFVAAGSASCHCIALDIDGRCFTWGRNEHGQLGHGDLQERGRPTIVEALSDKKVVKAASGRNHSIVVLEDGSSYSFGSNQFGQLGTGSLRRDKELSPVLNLAPQVTAVACGADFTVWITSKQGSTIMSAGLPQYGQLGHGTDNEYNAKDSSVKLMYEPQPSPKAISALSQRTIDRVACGSNHSVAVDTEGFVYTWGFGGHGRLGHREQKDEWRPRRVDVFQRANVVPPSGVVAAGSAFSAVTAAGGQLYMWGRVKSTGDNWMYPKPHMDLSGWAIRCMDCGNTSSAVGADESCITWGSSFYGELGYGEKGPKSSANPKKVDSLEKTHVIGVACGLGHTMFIVADNENSEVIEKLPVFEPNEDPKDGKRKRNLKEIPEVEEKQEEDDKEKEDVEDEEEEEEEEENDSEEEEKSKGRGKGRGRGRGTAKRGRGRGKSAGENKSEAGPKKSITPRGRARGRGRGKK